MDKKLELQKIVQEQIKTWLISAKKNPLVQQGIIVAILVGFILFFFLPIWMYNQKTSAQVKELERRIQTANAKIARIPEMNGKKEKYAASSKKIREQFFEAKEIDDLIEIISTAAAAAGVRITATRPTYKTVEMAHPFDQIYLPVSYELIIEGSYHNLGLFVNGLERYPKHFVVSGLEIGNNEKAQDVQRSTLSLTAFLKRG